MNEFVVIVKYEMVIKFSPNINGHCITVRCNTDDKVHV